jgi:hypothetical protein
MLAGAWRGGGRSVEIDLRRWAATLTQLADIRFTLRAGNAQLQQAQEHWLQAVATRDRAAADRMLDNRNTAIRGQAEAVLAEAERRAALARTELDRVQALMMSTQLPCKGTFFSPFNSSSTTATGGVWI